MGNRKQQILDRIRMRQEILDRINRSSLRGLVPHDFEIDSDTGEFKGYISFTPTPAFWERWEVAKGTPTMAGVRVMARTRFRRPRKNSEWAAQVAMACLDEK